MQHSRFIFVSAILNIGIFLFFLITDHYPIVLLLINFLSVLVLLIWSINIPRFFLYLKKKPVDLLTILLLFFIAVFVYCYKVDVITPGIQGDEVTIARTAEYILKLPEYVPFVAINYGHATPLLYLTGLSMDLLGRTIIAIRMPSIIFGALSVTVFYLLLRFFFARTLAITTALLMTFSYPLIIISRLAYETTPALFFQILTVLFLYLANKSKEMKYYILTGFSLGAGLYTYVGFRTFMLVVIGVCLFQLLKGFKIDKKALQRFIMLLLSFFLISMPLLSYSIHHSTEILSRTQSLSLFSQGLPPIEVYKELQGSVIRLTNLFLPTGSLNNKLDGDPNTMRNPSAVPFFDVGTFLLFLTGLIYLFIKNKQLLLLCFIISISPIVNDIFSLERIPEFHYYGIGHPNTLRIAGIIPIVYFFVAFGLYRIKPILEGVGKGIYLTLIIFLAWFLVFINWNLYFNQPFDGYIYNYNGAIATNIIKAVNKSHVKEVAISPHFLKDERVRYFIKKDIVINTFAPKNYEEAVSLLHENELVVFDVTYNRGLAQNLDNYVQNNRNYFSSTTLMTPNNNSIDAVFIFQR